MERKTNVKAITELLSLLLFATCILSIYGQVHYPAISRLILPALLLYFVMSTTNIIESFSKERKTASIIFTYFALLTLYLFYSVVFKENSILLAMRFYAVLLLLPLSFFVKPNIKQVNVFIVLSVIHSLFIIGLSLYLVIKNDPSYSNIIRHKYLNLGVGDVYTFNGWYYKVQVLGNSLIPVALFASVLTYKPKIIRTLISIVFLTAVIIAGNLAFLISVSVFIVMYLLIKCAKRKTSFFRTIIIFLLMIMLTIYPISISLFGSLSQKMEHSLPVRGDQVSVLIEDLTKTPADLIFGRGIGNTVDIKTQFRDYTGQYYYELQSVYILNQTGILMFLLFLLVISVLLYIKINSRYLILLYLSYVLYAISNPYIFDSTNILVIIIVVSLKRFVEDRGNCSNEH